MCCADRQQAVESIDSNSVAPPTKKPKQGGKQAKQKNGNAGAEPKQKRVVEHKKVPLSKVNIFSRHGRTFFSFVILIHEHGLSALGYVCVAQSAHHTMIETVLIFQLNR